MSRTVRPRSRRSLLMRSVSCCGLARVHPGGRLVEQEEDRVGRERPGDLQPALVAVRQVLGQLVVLALESDELEELLGALARRHLLGPVARRREERVDPGRLEPGVHPDEDVLQRGHVREEADVLERPAQPGDDHVVGSGAPEDPEPGQLALVRRRARSPPITSEQEQQRGSSTKIPMISSASAAPAIARSTVMIPAMGAGRTQTTGSSQARREWAIIFSPRNSIDAGGRVVDAGDDVEERRLAGAVRADQADDRPCAGS